MYSYTTQKVLHEERVRDLLREAQPAESRGLLSWLRNRLSAQSQSTEFLQECSNDEICEQTMPAYNEADCISTDINPANAANLT